MSIYTISCYDDYGVHSVEIEAGSPLEAIQIAKELDGAKGFVSYGYKVVSCKN